MNWQHTLNNNVGSELRYLKGGSGGGGGGGGSYSSSRGSSYSSRGGYYYGTNSSGGGSGETPTWVWIMLIVGSLLAIFGCIYKEKKKQDGIKISNKEFDAAVTKARENKQSSTTTSEPFQTYNGTFDVQYLDRGNVQSGTTKIRLSKENQNGYKIEGECSDADGQAVIKEGFATYNGDAFWVEHTEAGTDKGLKVLSEGTFCYETNTFTGKWRSNTGISGQYTSFIGRDISKTFNTTSGGAMDHNPQTLQEMLQVDIPMAVATLETPDQAPVAPEPTLYIPTVSAVPEPVEASAPKPSAPSIYIPH